MPSFSSWTAGRWIRRAIAVTTLIVTTLVASVFAAQAFARGASSGNEFIEPPLVRSVATTPGTVEITLTAEPTRLSLVHGRESDVFAYNGIVPGPTIDVHEGDRLVVHFRNRLPEATSIHWHGLHIPADMDGSPLRPVKPGGTYEYAFTIPRGSAGTYWYHPH
jgi:bilirubin oxidase